VKITEDNFVFIYRMFEIVGQAFLQWVGAFYWLAYTQCRSYTTVGGPD